MTKEKKRLKQIAERTEHIKKNPISRGIPSEAKAIVIYKAIELQDRGNFNAIDLDLLVMYALNIHLLKQVDQELAKDGNTITMVDRYGNSRLAPHPNIKTRKDLVAEIRRIGKLFGFTPFDSQNIQGSSTLSEIWERMVQRDEDDDEDESNHD